MKLGVRKGWAGAAVLITLLALTVVPSANPEQSNSQLRRLPSGFLDTGGDFTCAVISTGQVRCWGAGANGRLGYGNVNDVGDNESPATAGPVDLGAGRTAVAITAGNAHTCALLDTGQVRCWGNGADGRLGYGNTNSIGDNETPGTAGPVDLGFGRIAIAISAGGSHTCALLDTHQVRCWGNGANGRLGYGNVNDIGDNETPGGFGPVDLGPGRTAVAISAGGSQTCALLDNGTVRCWGLGTLGRLGYGNTTTIGDNETPGGFGPVDLGAGRTAVAVSTGAAHTCAVLDNGQVRCWGSGADGRLGYGNLNDIGDNETPGTIVPVDVGGSAIAISAGGSHTCVLLATGQIRCWGLGASGQLGYGNINDIGDNESPGSASPVNPGGLLAIKLQPVLSMTLKPKRDRKTPYRLAASGRLTGFLSDRSICAGQVTVKARLGKRSVTAKATLAFAPGTCSYTKSLRVKKKGKWKVTATFTGNGSLNPRAATPRIFRAG